MKTAPITGPLSEPELKSWAERLYEGNGMSIRFNSLEEAYEYAKQSDAERVKKGGFIFPPYIGTL